MNRAYLSIAAQDVSEASDAALFGRLAARLPFALEPAQRTAWEYQIQHLRELAAQLPAAQFFMEFLIPRMGRRADLIVIVAGIIFVAEYKLGARQFDRSSLDQVYGYGLDLKHFHETSHAVPIVPILVASHAPDAEIEPLRWDEDGLAQGLELDWACLCWDANFRRVNGVWQALQFKGTRWQAVNDPARQTYVANSYRVLLTRSRQGMVVFVPHGSSDDTTRSPEMYDGIYAFLAACGFAELQLRP